MKKLLIPNLPYWAFVFALAFPRATDARQPDQNAALYRQAAMIVNDVKAFDKGTGHKILKTFMIPYPRTVTQKTKLTVTIADNVIRKLTYVSYDEGHTALGVETYYFNANGKFVCHVNRATGVFSYDVYVDSVLVLWTKADDPTNRIMKGANALFQQAAAKYDIDYYLGAAGFTNYSTFMLSLKNRFRLRVLKDLPLHQSPDAGSPTLETLKKNTEIYYLDRSPNLDSVAHVGKWIWYRVSTKTAHVGWVWGYPSLIKEVSDDD